MRLRKAILPQAETRICPGNSPTLRMSLIAEKRRDEVNVRGISPN
jgi:hypothetical protein